MKTLHSWSRTALLAALTLAATFAMSQTYPVKLVTIVVPFAPGGIADVTARPLASALGKLLGQTFIVENRAGAGGALGAAYAAKQRPDGYTLMVALSSLSVIPEVEKLHGRTPSYLMDQFASIALISLNPAILIARSDAPWKTLADLVSDAKSRPERINYGSPGLYGTGHVATEMFAQAAGIRMTHVPFAGGGPSMVALLGGQIDFVLQTVGVANPHLQSGKVRVLGVFAPERIPQLPNVPTAREQGYEVDFYVWAGLFAPAGVPSDVLEKLRAAVREAVKDPGFVKAMAGLNTPIDYLDTPEFQSFVARDGKRLADVVRRMGKLE